VFTKNRERLLAGDIAEAFFQAVLQQARERSLLSDEHFTVDGTLLEAWASLKSFRKDGKHMAPPDDPGNATVKSYHPFFRSLLDQCSPNNASRYLTTIIYNSMYETRSSRMVRGVAILAATQDVTEPVCVREAANPELLRFAFDIVLNATNQSVMIVNHKIGCSRIAIVG